MAETETVVMQTVTGRQVVLPRRAAVKVPPAPPRGASSHFVGSTIVVMTGFAVATLAMNFGKNLQEQRLKPEAS